MLRLPRPRPAVEAARLSLVVLALLGAPSAAWRGARVDPALRERLAVSPRARVHAWVFFADRGPDVAARLARVEATLTPRARARRERGRRGRPLVDVFDLPPAPRYVEAVRRAGARIRFASRWLNAVSVDVDAAALERIAQIPAVSHLRLVRALRVPDVDVVGRLPAAPQGASPPARAPALIDYGPSFDQLDQIDVVALHEAGLSGRGVLVAMLDAGFNNLGHVSLQHLDIVDTWDFVNGDTSVADDSGQAGSGAHGTYTLSALAGYAPGSLVGPAYGASFALYKTENTEWERHVEEDAWAAAAERADSVGADIISSSLGYRYGFTPPDTSYTWQDMDGNTTIVARAADLAASRGILVVASAGNSGPAPPGENTLNSPADGDSVLAVAAVDASGARASFSSVGPSADGRIKPDVAARGVSTVAASPGDSTSFVQVSGTSLSCPLVAGAAALVLEAHPTLSNMEIFDRLRTTASQANAPDSLLGWGIVDARLAAFPQATHVGRDTPRAGVALLPAWPNPFSPVTTIGVVVDGRTTVRLDVIDVAGRRVRTLVRGALGAGTHHLAWNGRDDAGRRVAAGVYFARLVASGRVQARRLVLVR